MSIPQKAPECKDAKKQLMPFVASKATDALEQGLEVLELTVPFDEVELLKVCCVSRLVLVALQAVMTFILCNLRLIPPGMLASACQPYYSLPVVMRSTPPV